MERPSVIPRTEIPQSVAPEDGGIDVRPFVAHEMLGRLMPSSGVSVEWIHARAEQELRVRSHERPGLLIVLRGRAKLVSGLVETVEPGDVVTLPSHLEYGVSGVGEDGFQALRVTFHDEQERGSTLRKLLARNEARVQIALNNPFFSMLRERRLDSEHKRSVMRDCARIFADSFQELLFLRQATCRDDDFRTVYEQHLVEEFGHNKLLDECTNRRVLSDPVLKAVSTWFCHRMLVLDNVEKAVVNLVLESAGYYLGALAGPGFEGHHGEKFFHDHAEADADHKDVGAQLLEGQRPETYERLERVLDASWDMLEAMTRRIAFLVEAESALS